ncbi:MAG: nucleotidyltransferase family protein [bacterium]|nr:MAG: nucleotidyltransferase family protein [bacterium]
MKIRPECDEDRLLLACTGLHLDDAGRELIGGLLGTGLDWNYIVITAYRNNIAPLVYTNLSGTGDERVPADALTRLREICIVNTSRNMRLSRELHRVVELCNADSLPVMLLKGMALIHLLYRDIVYRPMCDIDILIHEDDFGRFRHTMSKLGFAPNRTLPDLGGRELVEYGQYFDQVKFYNNRVKIDTHFRLLNMGVPSADEEDVWDRARLVDMEGVPVRIPSAEDMLLHLCFHANHHHFASVMHFCDITETFRLFRDEIDWERFLRKVQARRMGTSIHYTLRYADALLGAGIPEWILDRLRPPTLRGKLFEFIWEKIIVANRERLDLGNLEGPVYYLLEMDGLREKALFIRKSLFPPLCWLASYFSRPASPNLYMRYASTMSSRLFRSIHFGAAAGGGERR